MRLLIDFLNEWNPISIILISACMRILIAQSSVYNGGSWKVVCNRLSRTAQWHPKHRYAGRLGSGTKFVNIHRELDPAMLISGVSMVADERCHSG